MSNIEKRKKHEIVKHDPEKILAIYTTPSNFREIKSVELAIKSDASSLAKIRKNAGIEVSLAILKVWIINLNEYLNIPRKMNELQIDETAELIYEKYYYLKMSDISLIFKRVKLGEYGKFYESIDGMKLLEIFLKYSQERISHFENNIKTQEVDTSDRMNSGGSIDDVYFKAFKQGYEQKMKRK